MNATIEFAAKMSELSAAFARRTFEDANELEALAAELLQGGETGAQRARVQYLAHRLVGGSSTFGLMVLEEPACQLEAEILDDASAEDISARSRALAAAIRRACGETADKAAASNAAP